MSSVKDNVQLFSLWNYSALARYESLVGRGLDLPQLLLKYAMYWK